MTNNSLSGSVAITSSPGWTLIFMSVFFICILVVLKF